MVVILKNEKGRFTRGTHVKTEFKKGHKGYKSFLGKKFSVEHRTNLSKSCKGRKGYWLGKTRAFSEEHKNNLSEAMKQLWKDKNYRKKVLGYRPKSSLELQMEKILINNNLPYKFVGDGSFSIKGKVPDFINTNGEKIAVEVFYRKHKEEFREDGLEGWKKDRINIFAEYGWDIIFFDEREVNTENVLRLLR